MVNAPPRLTTDVLAARLDLDEPAPSAGVAHGAAGRRIAGILDSLGWQSASEVPSADVAPEIVMMIRGCVRGHRQLDTLPRSVAELLRRYSHSLDGSGTAVASWTPFAAQVLDRYAGAPQGGAGTTSLAGPAEE